MGKDICFYIVLKKIINLNKKISNYQDQIESDPIYSPQHRKEKKYIRTSVAKIQNNNMIFYWTKRLRLKILNSVSSQTLEEHIKSEIRSTLKDLLLYKTYWY